MKVDSFKINIAVSIEGMNELVQDIKSMLEQRINLKSYSDYVRPTDINTSVVLRFCLLVGLSDKSTRSAEDITNLDMKVSNTPYATTFYTKSQIGQLFESLMKMRYHDVEGDWEQKAFASKAVGREILRGHEILLHWCFCLYWGWCCDWEWMSDISTCRDR